MGESAGLKVAAFTRLFYWLGTAMNPRNLTSPPHFGYKKNLNYAGLNGTMSQKAVRNLGFACKSSNNP
ncbi:hypothetical protein B4123_1088 [Bacillus paralicheniformis]|nr:hypothetical protein B4123_2294 [Bacillus paralicheniformis]OLG11747.1 hypothetical protein B4123_1855 [Bacillus paralicheniformis]OLG12496.1 hypothetical protein B4123_1088 [Bacillus paralicheniformis]TWJ59116.1 hypothetical protein CHCC5023_0164 [Bacillus paralicheniformis]TWN46146.1 hypothetical protein CHCC14523_1561 [Bacillus paralicheniformis]